MANKKEWRTNIAKKERKLKYDQRFYDQPKSLNEENFIMKTRYMLLHPNYLSLSKSAMIVYDYMKLWALNSTLYWEENKFEFSRSMLEDVNGVPLMSESTAKNAMVELQVKGFIDRLNNSNCESAEWRFSDRWITGIRQSFK